MLSSIGWYTLITMWIDFLVHDGNDNSHYCTEIMEKQLQVWYHSRYPARKFGSFDSALRLTSVVKSYTCARFKKM
jgi:hypothetical protein